MPLSPKPLTWISFLWNSRSPFLPCWKSSELYKNHLEALIDTFCQECQLSFVSLAFAFKYSIVEA